MFSDFRAFLLKTNALGLAIGVVIGVALGNVVNSLVNDIVMPPIGLLLGRVDFSSLVIVLQAGSGDAAEVAIRWGAFVNVLISFVVVAFAVFWINRAFIREPPPPPAPATKTCPHCRESVLAEATKCRYCGSPLPA